MRKFFITTALILLTATASLAAGRVTGVEYNEDMLSAVLSVTASLPTEYQVVLSGQRIDVYLHDVTRAEDVRLPKSKDLLIKTLVGQHKKGTVVSFMFRTPPTRVTTESPTPSSEVAVNVFWDSKSVDRRLAIAVQKTYKNKAQYAGRWKDFFLEHNSTIATTLDRVFQVPPADIWIPGLYDRKIENETLKRSIAKIKENDFILAASYLRNIKAYNLGGEELATVYAAQFEAYCKTGFLIEAEVALNNLADLLAPETAKRFRKWFSIFKYAGDEKPHLAYIELEKIKKSDESIMAEPIFQLIEAEIYMETGKKETGVKTLQALTKSQQKVTRTMAQKALANHYADNGKFADALEIFKKLEKDGVNVTNDLSMGLRFGESLFQLKNYKRAATVFDSMSWKSIGEEKIAMIFFGAGRSHLLQGNKEIAAARFGAAINSFPTSEGALRSLLELADIDALKMNDEHAIKAIKAYQSVLKSSTDRELREEAAFKEILVLHLSKRDEAAIDKAGTFIRDFFTSDLRWEAEALLSETLPDVIESLVEKENHLKALTLLDQYRHILIDDKLDKKVLEAAGKAFLALGLTDKAEKLFRFTIERLKPSEKDGPVYYQLAKTLRNAQRYTEALDTLEDRKKRFPKLAIPTNEAKLKAELLYLMGEHKKAINAAKSIKKPDRETRMIIAKCYKSLGDFKMLSETLKGAGISAETVKSDPHLAFIYAEALLSSNQLGKAELIYLPLCDQPTYKHICFLRMAQIYDKTGRQEQALNFYKQIAEGSSDSAWRSLGRLKAAPFPELETRGK